MEGLERWLTWLLGAGIPFAATVWAARHRIAAIMTQARARYRSARSEIARIDKLEEEIASLTRINAICIAERDLMYHTAKRLTEEGERVETAHAVGSLSTSGTSRSAPAGSQSGSPPSLATRGSTTASRLASRRAIGRRSRGRRIG